MLHHLQICTLGPMENFQINLFSAKKEFSSYHIPDEWKKLSTFMTGVNESYAGPISKIHDLIRSESENPENPDSIILHIFSLLFLEK